MKQTARFLGVAVVAIGISLGGLTTWADDGHNRGGYGSGYFGGYHWGGHYGGYYGGWYPWTFSIANIYAPSPYYYHYGYYYSPAAYRPSPMVYSSQPAEAYNSPLPAPVAARPQQPVVYRPLSPTAVDRDLRPPPPETVSPPQIQQSYRDQSIRVADVKALVTEGFSDEVILSQIRNSQSVYHLTTAEIIDLKNSGVSEKAIDFMINTSNAHR